jgi:hypothetical protein
MAKKFMFACIGILALTVAFLLGAQFGRAGYVDHSTTGIVATAQPYSNIPEFPWVLLDNGEVWRWNWQNGTWYRADLAPPPPPPPPVPVSEIKFFGYPWLVTTTNEFWIGGSTGWLNHGTPPTGTPVQPSTWGSIKAQFK